MPNVPTVDTMKNWLSRGGLSVPSKRQAMCNLLINSDSNRGFPTQLVVDAPLLYCPTPISPPSPPSKQVTTLLPPAYTHAHELASTTTFGATVSGPLMM